MVKSGPTTVIPPEQSRYLQVIGPSAWAARSVGFFLTIDGTTDAVRVCNGRNRQHIVQVARAVDGANATVARLDLRDD
jgi:hypothetical protein